MRQYLAVLRAPHMAALTTASLLARLPIGINGLAIVLFLQAETGSFAIAGAAAGATALGNGIGNPLEARIIDRRGARVLPVLSVGHAAGLVALVALGTADAPTAVLLLASLLTGALLPPTSMVLRARYPKLVPDLAQSAYAMDSVMTEIVFVAGPLLVGALAALASPQTALFVSAAAVVGGTFWFVAVLPGEEVDLRDRRRDPLGALRSPGIRTMLVTMAPVGFSLGALEVAIPAFSADRGQPELAGVTIAIWSVASAAGGLWYGARVWPWPLARMHLGVTLLLPLSFVPMLLAGSSLAMALLVVPAGAFIAPLIATRNELTGIVAPQGFETEAFTWPVTALTAGVAAGAAVGGAVADAADWRTAVAVAAAIGAVGAVVAVARRATLRGSAAPA